MEESVTTETDRYVVRNVRRKVNQTNTDSRNEVGYRGRS